MHSLQLGMVILFHFLHSLYAFLLIPNASIWWLDDFADYS